MGADRKCLSGSSRPVSIEHAHMASFEFVKEESEMAQTTFVDPLLFAFGLDPLSPSAAATGGKKGGGGGGGGTPGGGGGGGGGRPGETSAGNNLSVPAIFPGAAPILRGTEGQFTFTTPAIPTVPVDDSYVYFAQGVEDNYWQAGKIAFGDDDFNFDFDTDDDQITDAIAVDYVNIGDALESAPIELRRNIRLELSLFEQIADVTNTPNNPDDDTLTGFAMTLLGGAKGKGRPSITGPTESQGARLKKGETPNYPASADDYLGTTTYPSDYAAVYAADASSTEGETVDSYMKLVIQKVDGLSPQYAEDTSVETGIPGANDDADFLTGLAWDGDQWVDSNSGDGISVGDDISNVAFGPELTISGTYNVGASGTPWKFTSAGTYLITFALEDGTPVVFDENTLVRNDDPLLPGFQPTELSEGRLTQVVADGLLGTGGNDTHNGLLALLVGVPSSVGGGGEESALAGLL